jgi:hypothetical protein
VPVPKPEPEIKTHTAASTLHSATAPNGAGVCISISNFEKGKTPLVERSASAGDGADGREKRETSPAPPHAPPTLRDYAEYWNRHRGELEAVIDLSQALQRRMRAAIKSGLTPQKFALLVDTIKRTPFLKGTAKNSTGFKASFSWIFEKTKQGDENQIANILNGKFGEIKSPRASEKKRLEDTLSDEQMRMYANGEAKYAELLKGWRADAEKKNDLKEIADCKRLELEAKEFFAKLPELLNPPPSHAELADAAFLGQCGVEETNAKPPQSATPNTTAVVTSTRQ